MTSTIPAALATAATTAARRVLIIEDHDEARDSLRVLLSIHGCDVRVASNALDGVRLAMDWRPEVVISDLGLPDLDGWEVGQHVRAGLGKDVFLVAVSGHGRLADQQRSYAAGYDAHLAKPADLNEILRLLKMAA